MFSRNSQPPSGGYGVPSGPPPGYTASSDRPSQAPQHDWQAAVPDTSLLPPPPSMGFQASPANNATEDEAMRAKDWCIRNPLNPPRPISDAAVKRLDRGEITLIRPAEFKGHVKNLRPGIFHVKSEPSSPDSCFMSDIPLYLVDAHSPFHIQSKTKTIYFEVRVYGHPGTPINVGLGFVAQPYPTFRLPGWNRAGCGVHGDDGHKYVNDMWGGREFTQPFQSGQTLGIGMTFTLRNDIKGDMAMPTLADPAGARVGANRPIKVDIFFTRDGKMDGGWNLHEEGDAIEDLPVTGLEGGNDLFAAIGTFESADFQVLFKKEEWLFQPFVSAARFD